MTHLNGKKILLGVTGSIAAYKIAFLVRLLVRSGAETRIIMTPSATSFITPLTLSTLSRHPVFSEIRSEESWNNHVEYGLWADAMVIAPATAASIARLANGLSDNLLTASYLSARCPVFIAPAMDLDMWHHPATQENIRRLQERGNLILPVGYGELASGLIGEGRMAEPEEIVAFLSDFWAKKNDLDQKKILITAGPTYEPIDPVRFIGNRSSGRMGIALADAASRRGATVTLILGPSRLSPKEANINVIRVETARQMYEAALEAFFAADVAILAAAVADYRPEEAADRKLKKKEGGLTLELVQNPDIAAELGKQKKNGQVIVGFALETHDEEQNARRKLEKKNFDFIVLNSLKEKGAGFNVDTNKITILRRDGSAHHFDLKPKNAVAEDILDETVVLLQTKWNAE